MDLHERYRTGKERVSALARTLSADELGAAVPACPGWTVRDTLAHLVANADDGVAGRISGPPDDDQTAAQIASRSDLDLDALLDMWDRAFPVIEQLIAAAGPRIAPIMLDLLSHEQDILGALGRVGDRTSDDIAWAAETLVAHMAPSRPVTVAFADRTLELSPDAAGSPLRLDTTGWELLRLRMGRRSRRQALALAWSEDPSDVIDGFFVFGPSPVDIVE
jgi:uncharacterized protein (TIGR03083 family)